MKRLVGAAAFVLLVAACGGSGAETPATTAPPDATTSTTAPTTTTGGESTDTTVAQATTTTTAAEPTSGARFAIVEVGLGPLGQVFIQNVGDGPGSLAGHWLCQRPGYHELPDVELQPGDVAQVFVNGHDETFGPRGGAVFIEGTANVGMFGPTSGEIGLYSSNAFGSADAIVSYVEWGSASGHGRSDTAVAAGIWPAGGFVATNADSGSLLATTIPPTDPGHWTGG